MKITVSQCIKYAIKHHKWVVLGVLLVLIAEALFTGLIPHSKGYLYGILGAKAGPVWIAIGLYLGNYLFLEFFQSIKEYVIVRLSLRMRKDRTEKILTSPKHDIKSIPQRIQEDVKLSYISRITVLVEYAISALILIQLVILNLSIPWLTGAALVYAGISVYIAIKFNPRLSKAEIREQQKEASFREKLTDCLSPTGLIGANKASLMAARLRMHYKIFTKIQLATMSVLPYVVLVPLLFADQITLGTLVQHSATFSLMVVNASILIHYYTVWVKGTASEKRVKEINTKDQEHKEK